MVRVAKTLKEACELVEADFEYITDMDGKKIFRKAQELSSNISMFIIYGKF